MSDEDPYADIDYDKLGLLIGRLVAMLCGSIKIQLDKLTLVASQFKPRDKRVFTGYLWGLSTAIAEQAGLKTSGIISKGIYAGVARYFLLEEGRRLLEDLDSLIEIADEDFTRGVTGGGEDADAIREGKGDLPGLHRCFSKDSGT
ncbi:MAG TPA: hypothetical protein ENJ01_11410 [Gammaproteobacteria bacterium]|nr:hypothetical protein [Gammaproteobacteria bacterium]